jgi:oligoendopeptidase F
MTIQTRSEILEADSWDLQPLFKNISDWRQEYEVVSNKITKLINFKGTLAQSYNHLEEAISFYLELNRAVDRLYTYASLLSDTDTTDSTYQGLLQQALSLYTNFSSYSSFYTPEILAIEPKVLDSFISEEPLAPYRRMIQEIVRYRPHTLSEQEEKLLASATEVFSSYGKVFTLLNNADFNFGTINVDNVEFTLTHSNFQLFLKNPQRAIRETAYKQYYGVYDSHKYSLTANLTASIKKDIYLARTKKHSSSLERQLFSDNVKAEVYDNLIKNITDDLEPLHRYYSIRKSILNLEEQNIYDTYVSLVGNINAQHTYEEACALISSALHPLGQEYVEVLQRGLLSERWVDRYENKGKRSGAYSGGCYDSPPYILINYKDDDITDIFTLAHEAGHSMHSYFARQSQLYQDHGYTIFVAEVASTFNEVMLYTHLKKVYAENPKMLSFLVNQQIDALKATFFRQTMFAEFERTLHQKAEQNEPLTVDLCRELYGSLLKKYFGEGVSICPIDELEFLRIPHFYSSFYVYKYATGIAAAIYLANQVMQGDSSAVTRYINFLKAGGSKLPLDLLKDAGVDITSEEPILITLQLFSSLLDELSELNN